MPLPAFQMPQASNGAIDGSTASMLQAQAGQEMNAVQNFGQFQQNYVSATNQSQQSLIAGTRSLGESMAQMGEFIFNQQQKKHIEDEAAMLAPIKTFASSQALRLLSQGDQSGWNFLASATGIGAQNPILSRMNDSITEAGKAANLSFTEKALQTQKQLFDAQQAELDRKNALDRTQINADASTENTNTHYQTQADIDAAKRDQYQNNLATFQKGYNADVSGPLPDQPDAGGITPPGNSDILPPESTGGQPPYQGSPAQQEQQKQYEQKPVDGEGSDAGDDSTPITPPADLQSALNPSEKLTLSQRLDAISKSKNAAVVPISSTLDSAIGGKLVVLTPNEVPPLKKSFDSDGKVSMSYIVNDSGLTDTQKAIRAGMQKMDTSATSIVENPQLETGLQKYGGLGSGNIRMTQMPGTDGMVQFSGVKNLTDKNGNVLAQTYENIGDPVSKKYGDLFQDFQDGESQIESNGGKVALLQNDKAQTPKLVLPKEVVPYADKVADLLSRKENGKSLFQPQEAVDLIKSNLKPQKGGEPVLMPSGEAAINDAIQAKMSPQGKSKKQATDAANLSVQQKSDRLEKVNAALEAYDAYKARMNETPEQTKARHEKNNTEVYANEQKRIDQINSAFAAVGEWFKRSLNADYDAEKLREEKAKLSK